MRSFLHHTGVRVGAVALALTTVLAGGLFSASTASATARHVPSGCSTYTIQGLIGDRYYALKRAGRDIGCPTTHELSTPHRPGKFNHFQRGSIYYSATTGAHEIRGHIRAKWASLGWENSYYGFPTSDERVGINGWRYNTFSCGVIWYNVNTQRFAYENKCRNV